jgi:hypothetical protein
MNYLIFFNGKLIMEIASFEKAKTECKKIANLKKLFPYKINKWKGKRGVLTLSKTQ